MPCWILLPTTDGTSRALLRTLVAHQRWYSPARRLPMTLTAVSYRTRTNSPRSDSWARASGLLVDEWLLEREPPADLAEQLVCAWRGDVSEARMLLPDECVDMYWANGSMWVSGPETRSRPAAAGPGPREVGVCFRSGVAPSLLGGW